VSKLRRQTGICEAVQAVPQVDEQKRPRLLERPQLKVIGGHECTRVNPEDVALFDRFKDPIAVTRSRWGLAREP
jgi:hypothetical protein